LFFGGNKRAESFDGNTLSDLPPEKRTHWLRDTHDVFKEGVR
jgi:hypothetical protein